MGTASTMAMAVVSSVPRMNGSRPKWPWLGSQVFSHDPGEAERGEGRPGLEDDGHDEPADQGGEEEHDAGQPGAVGAVGDDRSADAPRSVP